MMEAGGSRRWPRGRTFHCARRDASSRREEQMMGAMEREEGSKRFNLENSLGERTIAELVSRRRKGFHAQKAMEGGEGNITNGVIGQKSKSNEV